MPKNNIIEINGKRYSTTPGRPLTGGKSVDPVVQSSPAHDPLPAHVKSQHAIVREPAHHHQSHPADHSHTLMRQAVKKPRLDSKHRLKAQGSAELPAKPPSFDITIKHSVQQLDKQRWQHAKHIGKSRMISRFSEIGVSTAYVPPAPVSAHPAAPHVAGAQRKRPRTTADLLEHALQHAKSHEEPPPPLPRHHRVKRSAGIGASIVLSGLLLGVIVVQNLSNVRLQIASAKAGFSASLPGYKPVGFSLGQLHYSSGVVAAQFNGSDKRHYSVTQQRSSWDSTTLRDSFVAPRDPNYQTDATDGRAIFLYGQGNATWVNGGIWYVVQSDGSLSTRQVMDLASSL